MLCANRGFGQSVDRLAQIMDPRFAQQFHGLPAQSVDPRFGEHKVRRRTLYGERHYRGDGLRLAAQGDIRGSSYPQRQF